MNIEKLHTKLLEAIFGPIKLHILRQEDNFRIVHLYDQANISRTLGIVRFADYLHPMLNGTHHKIMAGHLLGQTLSQAKIPYTKTTISRIQLSLPDWLQKEFRSNEIKALALYSHIYILEQSADAPFLYADLFEIITPDMPDYPISPDKTTTVITKEMISLLNLAGFTQDQIIINDD